MSLREGDYMHEIVSYIKRNTNIGYTKDELRFMLIKRGYSRSAVERAFRLVEQNQPKVEEKPKTPAKVVVVESEKEEPEKPKTPGLFSKLKAMLTVKPETPKALPVKYEKDETVRIDENGNLLR